MKRTGRTAVLAVVMASGAGCALTTSQRDATADVAEASTEVGEFAAKEFGRFRSATIEMNALDLAIRGHAKIDDLDGVMNPDRILERIESAQALSSYGRLLLSLVNDTQEAELVAAASAFVDRFSGLDGRHLSDGQLHELGRMAAGAGSFWGESGRAKAIKEIVPAVRPDLNTLCDLLMADLSPRQQQLATGFETTIRQLRQDTQAALEDPAVTHADRLIAINGRRRAQEEAEHLEWVSAQAVRTLETLKAAHEQLVDSLAHDRPAGDDVRRLGSEINALRTAIEALAAAD